ncbi:MAG: NAD(P)/FAD-dependent oxidoreductase [Bacillota bacterium]|jgi:thioredoxin reductase (NADPH)
MHCDVFIVGAGPAGLTAAMYGARAGFSVIVADPGLPGGQTTMTHQIDNYPGFPDGIDGFTLGDLFSAQAKKWGAEIVTENVVSVVSPHGPWQIKTDKNEYTAKALIIASGTQPKHIGFPGEEEFVGRGVSYCGTCDGPLYRGKTVAVLGGGNTALQEASFLSRFVEKIYLIHRRDTYRAQQVLVDDINGNPKITPVLNASVKEIYGGDLVRGIRVLREGKEEDIAVDGVFIFLGHTPNTLFCEGLPAVDDNGRLITNEDLECSSPGLFAIGDVRSKKVYQVATAVGDGAAVIHSVQEYLKTVK